ncbi:hypothetical protein Bphy_7340 (plasmid) [Paraburkholderia phymatum STM815]|uniref:Uncharacterized protein n=1 Tax=Paraburkholderia phymatum (strain DSM 17167 / CIP 108236 / LMG 21445 / STM815) TaxID=391038 RepID=B2JXG7_PARP8|nr:hypothetical protein Bphy_7340 [Paraburkholderia phymatum STM815]
MLYGVGDERDCAVARIACFVVGRVLDAWSLENPRCHLAACILVAMHLPDSVDRVPQPCIGNSAMCVALPVSRRGRRIVQLPVAVRHRDPLWNSTDMTHRSAASQLLTLLIALRG